ALHTFPTRRSSDLAAREQHQMMMQALGAQIDERREIRSIENPQFMWTRRFIAISAVLSVIVLPKVAAVMWPLMPITVGWTEWSGGFCPFTSGQDVLTWHVAKGLVLTPLDTHLVSPIAGL